MYKALASIVCAVFLAGCSALFMPRMHEERIPHAMNSAQAVEVVLPPPDSRLPEHEVLTYEMRWVGIPVGTMTTSIKGVEKVNGRDAYVLEASAKTNAFCSFIYKIDDTFISWLDVEKLYSLRHEVHRSEGKYRKNSRTDFDQEQHTAHFKNFVDNTEKKFDIPPAVQDIITASYYFMLLQVKPGDKVEYSVCNNEQVYKLTALIGRERIAISLKPPIGEKSSFMVQPFAELKGETVDKGRVTAYYSTESRRLPLYAIVQAPVFTSVTISLLGYQNTP